MLAVLGRHGGIGLGAADVFVNVVGGVRVDEPGADLAVALAVASAAKRIALLGPAGGPLACFGELGLTGELRTVAHADRRLAEAAKFGLAERSSLARAERFATRASGAGWRGAGGECRLMRATARPFVALCRFPRRREQRDS